MPKALTPNDFRLAGTHFFYIPLVKTKRVDDLRLNPGLLVVRPF